MKNATESWDLPDDLFQDWLGAHSETHHNYHLLPKYSYGSSRPGARVILDDNGRCHVIPFWTVRPYDWQSEIKLFGNLNHEAMTVISIDRSRHWGETFHVGWQTPVQREPPEPSTGLWSASLYLESTKVAKEMEPATAESIIRDLAIKMDVVMKALRAILAKAATMHRQDLPEIFRDRPEPERLEVPGDQANPTRVPGQPDFRRRRNST